MKNLSCFLKKKSALITLIKSLMCYYARRGKKDPERKQMKERQEKREKE